MLFDPAPGPRVEKIMSPTRAEFETGLERLTGAPAQAMDAQTYDLSAAANGLPATCTYEPQADAVLGGLVRLPRILVTLHLEALSTEQRVDLVGRFDRVFQRGGG